MWCFLYNFPFRNLKAFKNRDAEIRIISGGDVFITLNIFFQL